MILLVVLAALAPWTQAAESTQTVRMVTNHGVIGQQCSEIITDCDTFLTELKKGGYEDGSCTDALGKDALPCKSLSRSGSSQCFQNGVSSPFDWTSKGFVTNEKMCPAEGVASSEDLEGHHHCPTWPICFKGTEAKPPQCEDGVFGQNFCSGWCNTPGKWGCGTATLVGDDPRNTANTDYTCDCTGCNSCSESTQTVRMVQNIGVIGQQCREIITDCDTYLTQLKKVGYEDGSCADALGKDALPCKSLSKSGSSQCFQNGVLSPIDWTSKGFVTNEKVCPAEEITRTLRNVQENPAGNNEKVCQEVTMTDCDSYLAELIMIGFAEGTCADALGKDAFPCKSLDTSGSAQCSMKMNGAETTKDYTIKGFVNNKNMCQAEGVSSEDEKDPMVGKHRCKTYPFCFGETEGVSSEDVEGHHHCKTWPFCFKGTEGVSSEDVEGHHHCKTWPFCFKGTEGVSSEDEKDPMVGKHHCKTYPFCFGETEETEAQALAFEATDTDQHSMPVKVLAAFGFVVTLYGAFKHFSK